ncbi:bai1-associated protein 2-like 2 [Lynx pardinus]|uniref:Bai1-associated protein 2-like 2 n=1 Tax=Lynx pardinus TaxID=191816 RepID=A0A485MUF9_LYNPA|nr:bai1-associated protein 2-like 2 [Lynx pardinus]
MAPEMDQFYRSTMAIYKSIMEQFNPALENLVYLGNNYLRAFHGFLSLSPVAFLATQAVSRLRPTCHANRPPLSEDLSTAVQTFHGDLLQHMEKNTKLDVQFIKSTRMPMRSGPGSQDGLGAPGRASRRRWFRKDRGASDSWHWGEESVNRLHAQMQAFMSESQRAAELEEKRRYRFLAEKHLLLSNTFLHFFGRVSGGRGRA